MTGIGESYWILSGDQLDCLASSRRQAILDLIATFGPVSADDLARLSGMRRTTIYQHIAKLESAGLVSGRKTALGPETNLLFHRFVGTASGENLTEINRKIEELKALIYTETPAAGQPIAITIAMAPVDRV